MKPLKLELDHIGPFASHADINFEALGDIFLIHGKTGSGKTTIFDAICYALYGKLPGPRRDQLSRLKSDFSPPEAIPKVALEFAMGSRIWRVERSPSSLRPKKKGQGLRMSDEEVVLFERMPDGRLDQIEGMKSKADDALARIIGLSPEEFARIILLPQGEFAEFLRQNSKDRREVLKKLFPVEDAERVKDLAQERSRQLHGALAEAERRLQDLEGSVNGQGDESPEERVARERELLEKSEERLSQLKDSIDGVERYRRSIGDGKKGLFEARARLEEAEQALAAALGEQTSIARKREALSRSRAAEPFLRLSERREEAQRAREEAGREETAATNALDEAKRNMEEATKQKRVLEELRTKSAGLMQSLAALEELAAEEARSAEALEEMARLDRETGAARAQLAELARREEALVTEERTLLPFAEGLETLGSRKNEKRTRLDVLNALVEWARENARIQRELERTGTQGKTLRAERDSLLEAIQDAEKSLAALQERFEARQTARLAARLAANLEKGLPCPVCGSAEHPLPAAAPGGNAAEDDEALRKADKLLRERQGELARIDAALLLAREEYKRYQNERDHLGPAPAGADAHAITAALEGPDGSISLLSLLEKERAAVLVELNELTGPEKEANKAAARIHEIRPLRDRIAAERQTLDREQTHRAPRLAVLETELSALSARRDKLLALPACAGSRTGEEARQRIELESRTIAEHSAAIEAEIEAAIQTLAAAGKRLEHARERHTQSVVTARNASEAFSKALEESPFTDEEALESALEALAEREGHEEAIREHEKRLEAARALRNERERSVESAREALESILSARPPVLDVKAADGETTGTISRDTSTMEEEGEGLLAHCEKTLATLRELLGEAQTTRDLARDRIAGIERQGREYAEARERRSRLSMEAAEYDRLYRDLAGTNASRKAFDAWLMGMYLREVTACASKRLEKMSEGRYRLMVDSDNGRRNALTGLDLAVWDACTGKMRPCATLSGGESFMASISLALGLADSIQNRSGGIRLDALFIDEGFGSLDEQSLEQAMNILDEIRDHRMVGLISHVGEMRTRIPSRVEVIKGSSGSTLRVATVEP